MAINNKRINQQKWGAIQDEGYKKIRKREKLEVWYTGTWWTKQLIKHIIFWALNEWQKRNEYLHNEINDRNDTNIRKKCSNEIMILYQQQEDRPKAHLKRYFRLPLIEKLQQSPNRQKQLIETIRALQDKSVTQNSKNKV